MKLSTIIEGLAGLGVKLTLIVPSFFGGLLALYFFDEPAQPGTCERCKKVTVVLGGAGLGLFCGPALVDAFGLTDKNGRLEIGFALLAGALGMAIVANALKAIRSVNWTAVLEGWVRRGSGG